MGRAHEGAHRAPGVERHAGQHALHRASAQPGQYYDWRDQFLANASKAFEVHQQADQVVRLERENSRLKRVVADLTLEVKNTEELLG